MEKPVYKSFYRYRGVFAGVCDGIATYFNISIWWPRLIFSFPFIFGFLLFLDAFIYDLFPSLPDFPRIFWDVRYIGDAYTDFGYYIKPFAESLSDISVYIILLYILAWLFIPKATTDFKIKQLKSKWEYSDELEKSIFNKISFKMQSLEN